MCAGARSTCPRKTHRHSSLVTRRYLPPTPTARCWPRPCGHRPLWRASLLAPARTARANATPAPALLALRPIAMTMEYLDAGAGDLQGPIP